MVFKVKVWGKGHSRMNSVIDSVLVQNCFIMEYGKNVIDTLLTCIIKK